MLQPILWYFADPMCSWCWGFAPVIELTKAHFAARCKVALVLGGLRPYTREPLSDELRQEILHHWRQVNNLTGQEFNFDDALPEGFVYDTEPACRAVVAVGELFPDETFAYFKALQKAFYVGQQDLTQEAVLMRELTPFIGGRTAQQHFLQIFDSEACRQKTQAHFYKSRQFGVRGFPTLVLQTMGSKATTNASQNGASQTNASPTDTSPPRTSQTKASQPDTQYFLITNGYKSSELVQSEIESSLSGL